MSRCGKYRGYDDDWILKNIDMYTSWKQLFDEYHKKFGFGTYRNFRSHLYSDLKLTRKFTKDQDEWIYENYPTLGSSKATEEFNKFFGVCRSKQTIICRASKLGVKVSNSVSNRLRSESNHLSKPIGSTVVRTNSYGSKSVWQKTENGWVRQAHLVLGEIPEGKVVVHYDGDFTNNTGENLVAISKRVNARMTFNRFWSEDPTITKTGVMCLELEEALEEKEI